MLTIHIEIDIGDLVMDFELKQMKPGTTIAIIVRYSVDRYLAHSIFVQCSIYSSLKMKFAWCLGANPFITAALYISSCYVYLYCYYNCTLSGSHYSSTARCPTLHDCSSSPKDAYMVTTHTDEVCAELLHNALCLDEVSMAGESSLLSPNYNPARLKGLISLCKL